MTSGHRLRIESNSKGFTALVTGTLIEGAVEPQQPGASAAQPDLPRIDQATTIGHLLSQTSGPRHYLDVPVHTLEGAEGFLPVLDGHAQVSTPGQRFTYNNAGYVLLALLAQRVAGESFRDLVRTRVLEPAGMGATDFPQSDEPGPGVAHGYLHEKGLRTNVLHLPVRGSGDGGAVTTAADLAAFWAALLEGRIVSPATLEMLTAPLTVVEEEEEMRYGRGFWRGLHSDALILEGYDAGVSGRTWHDPATGITASVLANDSEGA